MWFHGLLTSVFHILLWVSCAAAEESGGHLGWLLAIKHLLASLPQGSGTGAQKAPCAVLYLCALRCRERLRALGGIT